VPARHRLRTRGTDRNPPSSFGEDTQPVWSKNGTPWIPNSCIPLVVLANSDQIDKLGVAVPPSIPLKHLLAALWVAVFASFRSLAALQLEILALRHQLRVLQRSVKRPKLTPADCSGPNCAPSGTTGSPASLRQRSTVIGSNRKGFRFFWAWKVRHSKPSRPTVPKEVRAWSRTMSRENALWGAPRKSRRGAQAGHRAGIVSKSQAPKFRSIL
jgi:hypothetical protein